MEQRSRKTPHSILRKIPAKHAEEPLELDPQLELSQGRWAYDLLGGADALNRT